MSKRDIHLTSRVDELERGHDRHEAMIHALANAIGVNFVKTKIGADGKPVAVDKDGREVPLQPVEKPRIIIPL